MPRAIVHVEAADPAHATAAGRAAAGFLAGMPQRRGLTGLVVGWGSTPGLSVAPWTLRGVNEAVPDSLTLHWEAIASVHASDRALRGSARDVRLDTKALERGALGERRVALSIPGQRRAAAIPRAWVGTSLCVVAPLCHRANGREHLGPVQLTLTAIAKRCGLDGPAASLARAGATIVADAFCSTWLVLDATWWATLSRDGYPVGDPAAIEHCLGTSALGDPAEAAAVDQWIGALLGHRAPGGPRVASPPKVSGHRRPWPTVPLPSETRAFGLAARLPTSGSAGRSANRAFDALWRTGRAAMASRTARGPDRGGRVLSAAPPGRFAEHWTRWSADGR